MDAIKNEFCCYEYQHEEPPQSAAIPSAFARTQRMPISEWQYLLHGNNCVPSCFVRQQLSPASILLSKLKAHGIADHNSQGSEEFRCAFILPETKAQKRVGNISCVKWRFGSTERSRAAWMLDRCADRRARTRRNYASNLMDLLYI